jgi:hypothetical protein
VLKNIQLDNLVHLARWMTYGVLGLYKTKKYTRLILLSHILMHTTFLLLANIHHIGMQVFCLLEISLCDTSSPFIVD